jgi:hypothetical protein
MLFLSLLSLIQLIKWKQAQIKIITGHNEVFHLMSENLETSEIIVLAAAKKIEDKRAINIDLRSFFLVSIWDSSRPLLLAVIIMLSALTLWSCSYPI